MCCGRRLSRARTSRGARASKQGSDGLTDAAVGVLRVGELRVLGHVLHRVDKLRIEGLRSLVIVKVLSKVCVQDRATTLRYQLVDRLPRHVVIEGTYVRRF